MNDRKKKKRDYTCSPETWAEAGGVYCSECKRFLPQSLFSMYDYCTKHNWNQTQRAGSVMTGCNRGEKKDV